MIRSILIFLISTLWVLSLIGQNCSEIILDLSHTPCEEKDEAVVRYYIKDPGRSGSISLYDINGTLIDQHIVDFDGKEVQYYFVSISDLKGLQSLVCN